MRTDTKIRFTMNHAQMFKFATLLHENADSPNWTDEQIQAMSSRKLGFTPTKHQITRVCRIAGIKRTPQSHSISPLGKNTPQDVHSFICAVVGLCEELGVPLAEMIKRGQSAVSKTPPNS